MLLDKGFEWVDGQLVEKPMGAEASVVGGRLLTRLLDHAEANKLGFVFNSECSYQFTVQGKRQVRKPDLSFIARGRLPGDRVPRGNVTIPPDLGVEVVSPNDVAEDLEKRISELFAFGTKLIWVVYPETRTVYVLRSDGTAARLSETQDLSGESVVPGFSCPIANLFIGL
jgi:Uma2 family endonuclease